MKTPEVLDCTFRKRPGHGVSPVFWEVVVGRRLAADVAEGQLLRWTDLAELRRDAAAAGLRRVSSTSRTLSP